MLARHDPEQFLATAVAALSGGRGDQQALDALPVPIYVTDAAGAVTYWNQACVDFAGRDPQLGEDRWCVVWHLYTTTGEPLPFDKSPMAQAIREKRPIRNVVAIAERPDGRRVALRPYPTPLVDADGSLRGAVNMLIDVTHEQCVELHEQAERCRRLAAATYDRATRKVLEDMAKNLEKTADELSAS
jgi:PAS domain S-box-containing protein